MDEQQKAHYRARMAVAQLLRVILAANNEYKRVTTHFGIADLPITIPALGDTLAADIHTTVRRYIESGIEHVIVSVLVPMDDAHGAMLYVLHVTADNVTPMWQPVMDQHRDSATMADVVARLGDTTRDVIRYEI